MNWIVTIILAFIALVFFLLYWKGVKQRNYLRSLLIQILLDEKTYEFQKEGLKNLILNMNVRDAADLSRRVNISVDSLAYKISSQTILATHSLLWEMKKNQPTNNENII